MITVKEIAKLAGVSPSTVSIVLNNKSKERKLSEETVSKVLAVAQKHGYRPNVQAVGLRVSPDSDRFRIIIFWTADYRASMMLRFIKSIEREILAQHYTYEVLLRPYKNGQLKNALTEELIRSCHGVIVCNASEEDMQYLDSNSFTRPVVLYNRYSKLHTTANVDDAEIGAFPAEIFISHKKKHPALVTYPVTFNGMNLRNNVFCYKCEEAGLPAPPVYVAPAGLEGGYQATRDLLKDHPETDCIFYTSDILALGSLKYYAENDISVPDKIEFIATGNYEDDWCINCYPSVSVVRIPIEEMGAQCLRSLHSLMTYKKQDKESVRLPVTYIPRDSCPK